ncbi:MAG: DedA family protein [Pseudomonadota bacterium]
MTDIEGWIAQYGLLAIVVGAALEGETVAMIGGMSAHRGLFALPAVWAAVLAGTLIADQGLFYAGRLLKDRPRIAKICSSPRFASAQARFERYPQTYVMLFRFFYGLRTVSPVLIGTSGFSPMRFAILNLVAAIAWSLLFVGLGYAFGLGIERLYDRMPAFHVWLPYLLIPIGVGLLWKLSVKFRRS